MNSVIDTYFISLLQKTGDPHAIDTIKWCMDRIPVSREDRIVAYFHTLAYIGPHGVVIPSSLKILDNLFAVCAKHDIALDVNVIKARCSVVTGLSVERSLLYQRAWKMVNPHISIADPRNHPKWYEMQRLNQAWSDDLKEWLEVETIRVKDCYVNQLIHRLTSYAFECLRRQVVSRFDLYL